MTDIGRDTKTYPTCNPYHGEEGAKWTRIFKIFRFGQFFGPILVDSENTG